MLPIIIVLNLSICMESLLAFPNKLSYKDKLHIEDKDFIEECSDLATGMEMLEMLKRWSLIIYKRYDICNNKKQYFFGGFNTLVKMIKPAVMTFSSEMERVIKRSHQVSN